MSLLLSWLRLRSSPSKGNPCPCVSHDSITIVEKADVLKDQLADARSQRARRLVQSILDIHSQLLKLPHYRPGKPINQLLTNLVSLCSEIYDREVVDKVREGRPRGRRNPGR